MIEKQNGVFFIITVRKEQFNDIAMIDEAALGEFGCVGIEEYSLDEECVDEILGTRAFSGGIVTDDVFVDIEAAQEESSSRKYFFYDKELGQNFSNYLKKMDVEVVLSEEAVEDWNSLWRESFKPIDVDDNLRVIPEWMRDDFPGKENVYIYPGMGFGTGGHETTYLCLKRVSEFAVINSSWNCLDLGCGSGILGIAALKLGASSVVFCDVDSDALDNCHHNLKLNFDVEKLDDSSIVSRERLVIGKEYDLVAANILISILKEEYSVICRSVKKGGVIILSGILNSQVDDAIKFYTADNSLELKFKESKGDWAALVLTKIK